MAGDRATDEGTRGTRKVSDTGVAGEERVMIPSESDRPGLAA